MKSSVAGHYFTIFNTLQFYRLLLTIQCEIFYLPCYLLWCELIVICGVSWLLFVVWADGYLWCELIVICGVSWLLFVVWADCYLWCELLVICGVSWLLFVVWGDCYLWCELIFTDFHKNKHIFRLLWPMQCFKIKSYTGITYLLSTIYS